MFNHAYKSAFVSFNFFRYPMNKQNQYIQSSLPQTSSNEVHNPFKIKNQFFFQLCFVTFLYWNVVVSLTQIYATEVLRILICSQYFVCTRKRVHVHILFCYFIQFTKLVAHADLQSFVGAWTIGVDYGLLDGIISLLAHVVYI